MLGLDRGLVVFVIWSWSVGVQGFAPPALYSAVRRARGRVHGTSAIMQLKPGVPDLGRRHILLGVASASLGLVACQPALASADVVDEDIVEAAARQGVQDMLASVEEGSIKTQRMLANLRPSHSWSRYQE